MADQHQHSAPTHSEPTPSLEEGPVKILLLVDLPLEGTVKIGPREYPINGTVAEVEMAVGEEIRLDTQYGSQILGKVPAGIKAGHFKLSIPDAWHKQNKQDQAYEKVPRGPTAFARELWVPVTLLNVVIGVAIALWLRPSATMSLLVSSGTSGLIIFGGAWGVIGLGYAINVVEGVLKGEFGKLWEDFWSPPMLHAAIVGLPSLLPMISAWSERAQGRVEGALYAFSIPFLVYACFVQREERRFDGSPLLPLLNGLLFGAVVGLWQLSLIGRIICGVLLVPIAMFEFFKPGAKMPNGKRVPNRLYAGLGFVIAVALALLSARPAWAVLLEGVTLVLVFVIGIIVWTGVRESVHMKEVSLKTLDIFPVVILEVVIVVTPWLIFFIGKVADLLKSWGIQ